MDEEIAEQFAQRDRMRKQLAARETYSQRMQKMAVLQESTWKALQASPTGWAHFLRRNFKARAIDVATPDAPDLQILDILRRHRVPFVVIGGHAVNAHGFRRATEDTDVIWLRSRQSEESLLIALTELDARYIGREIDPATGIERTYPVTLPYIQASHLMMLWTTGGFLDLFDYIPGLPTEAVEGVFASTIEVEGIRYPSLADLRRMKKASGRTIDLLDLENLPD